MKVSPVPRFALYGETASAAVDMLHVEEVRLRSHRHQWEIDPHLHQGLFQVLWIHSGEARTRLDEHSAVVLGPAAILVPPGVVHGFRFAPEVDGFVLTVSGRFMVEGDGGLTGDAFAALFASSTVVGLEAGGEGASRLDALFRALATEVSEPGGDGSPVPAWLARAILWRLARERAAQERAGPGEAGGCGHRALFTRFLVILEEHFVEHWSVARYAGRLGVSPARLNRLVRQQSGRSALEMVHDRLLREACRRLVYVAAPVANLALELGFEDPAYFSRFFKRRMGMSPHRWRRQSMAAGLAPPDRDR
jgi:AraC family transcriptional activator of pobA